MKRFLVGVVVSIVCSSMAYAATCPQWMLIGNRWSDVKCEDKNGDGRADTVAWYNHRSGSITEVVFSSAGVELSRTRLGRQARRPESATLASVCPTRTALARTDVWKSRQSNHIPGSDSRKNSTALIILRGGRQFASSCMSGYSSSGKLVHKLGAYYPTGSLYNKRLYGGYGCGDRKTPRQVAAAASGGLYLKVSANSCVKVPNPNTCYNSSGC